MEILVLVVVIAIWYFLRANLVYSINSLQGDVEELTAKVQSHETQLQEKVATKSDLYNLEQKLARQNEKPFYLDDDSTF